MKTRSAKSANARKAQVKSSRRVTRLAFTRRERMLAAYDSIQIPAVRRIAAGWTFALAEHDAYLRRGGMR
jgi:hypothetical protein